jgi:AraC-like DNA-binding protein
MHTITIKNERRVPKILASAANGVLNLIGEYGGDIGTIFERANIAPSIIDNPLNELGLKEYCDLFDTAAEQICEDSFGLLFGSTFTPHRLGPVGYIAINSPTLYSALRNFISFFPAHQDCTCLNLAQERGVFRLDYAILDNRITNPSQDAELSIAIFSNIFKHVLGSNWAPLEIHFSHENFHGSYTRHEHFFNCPVRFNQPSNSILFRKKDLNTIIPNCDPYLFSIIESTLKQRQELKLEPENLVNAIKHHIKVNIGDSTPTLSDIATKLDLRTTNIKKKLSIQGVTFNDLVKASRQELAIKYLAESDMQLTEIAFALGYSELSAFSRAFRAWSGMSPQHYRRLNIS